MYISHDITTVSPFYLHGWDSPRSTYHQLYLYHTIIFTPWTPKPTGWTYIHWLNHVIPPYFDIHVICHHCIIYHSWFLVTNPIISPTSDIPSFYYIPFLTLVNLHYSDIVYIVIFSGAPTPPQQNTFQKYGKVWIRMKRWIRANQWCNTFLITEMFISDV